VTASSVASDGASVKVPRGQLEELARALRVPLRVSESGASLFRRCVERASKLEVHSGARLLMVEVEGNEGALDALRAFNAALGGGRRELEEEAEAPPEFGG
jgi:hypothetical protein